MSTSAASLLWSRGDAAGRASRSARPARSAAPRRRGRARASARPAAAPPGPSCPPPRCRRRPRSRYRRACRARSRRNRRGPAPPRRRAWRSPAPRARDIASAPRPPVAAASPAAPRATRLPRSLLAEPSTPSPTRTPASRIARTGAMPEPSRQFEQGQCATPVRLRAKRSISGRVELHAMGVPDIVAGPAQILGILSRPAAEALELNRRRPRRSRPDGCAASRPCRAPAAPRRASARG